MASPSDEPAKELVHKTKVVQFLGRTTPIILQNDNGPCPLLAICNVLLLKNSLNLGSDIPEVSQEKLLSLVAERLIDSNSNVNNKDAGYVENQQQNIADAIDLLHRLATGIDVNIKFRRIDDFEFTRECAIFDLLDIPLYHGWIVDPQDVDTVNAVGSKSYNTLTGELVALETLNLGSENMKKPEEDFVDFAAATTATLGVPSPCLSRGRSFDDSPQSVSDHDQARKGDLEEEAELLRALKLSGAELPPSAADALLADSNGQNPVVTTNESAYLMMTEPVIPLETLERNIDHETQKSCQQEPMPEASIAMSNYCDDLITFETVQREDVCLASKADQGKPNGHLDCNDCEEAVLSKESVKETGVDEIFESETAFELSACGSDMGNVQVQYPSTSTSDIHDSEVDQSGCSASNFSCSSTPNAESNSMNGRRQNMDVVEAFTSTADGSEPMYEGEECILESRTATYENREPMYEGEVVLAEQVDKDSRDGYDAGSKDGITSKQGELISNFLKNSASQLTVYGLFCLQDGLKERELCVFFRNNHFSTMFKFDGELYLLATDQGYINQPDLVWEKLNEVNGDTLFMTGNFKEFKLENHAQNTWDEQNAMANTADYLASIDNSAQEYSSFNSDMQLAIALQQQEFEQQPQPQPLPLPQPPRNTQQPPSGSSRLVTGTQVSLKLAQRDVDECDRSGLQGEVALGAARGP
ncbi:hypothetical protein RJ640_027190 [Escallonia rubra]|uniref:MINDY deubiquitinase domain-containing protein n=1 Tax=Escallonia rubra TaxID=112253 RepID=A0AA88R2F5_9ASTE|nr:hypothetical protein RJ640_027190 [Escallonia rubra]